MDAKPITADFVRQLNAPTEKFLCKISDNWADFKFRGFKIRDMVSNITLVEVPESQVDNNALEDDPSKRLIRYHLGPDFLELQTVGLTMYFSIGPTAIKNMELVERHYFRGRCIRDFGFKFGFVIPNSTNSWEFIYEMPELTDLEKEEIIQAPWEVKSDSFYFANGVLMIHNRCEYNYSYLD